MEFKHEDGRIYLEDPKGNILAEVLFPVENDVIQIKSTFVDPSLRGKGVASKLTDLVYEYAKENDLKVNPICTYAVKWFSDNKDKADVL